MKQSNPQRPEISAPSASIISDSLTKAIAADSAHIIVDLTQSGVL